MKKLCTSLLIAASLASFPAEAGWGSFFLGLGSGLLSSSSSNVQQNHAAGKKREKKTVAQLKKDYPKAKIQNEQPLRTPEGKIAKDPLSGTGRRLDHVVIEDGEVKKSVETTSLEASKDAQLAKELRMIRSGDKYIKDRETGDLLPVPGLSEVVRHE